MHPGRLTASRGSTVRVFLLVFVVYAYFMPRWSDWNADSRLDLVHAIVDHQTLRIDAYHWNTWDKASFHHHFYSDKAPGTALLGVPVYALFVGASRAPLLGTAINRIESSSAWNIAISLGRSDTQTAPGPKGKTLGGCQRAGSSNVQYIPWGNRLVPPVRAWALSKYVTTAGVVGLLSALFAAFFFWFLGFFMGSALLRGTVTGLYAVATAALAYSTNFYSHQLSAAFLFSSFALLFLRSRGSVGSWAAPVAGFLLGFAVFTEYTVALIVPIIGVYALWIMRRRRGNLAAFVVAALLPVTGLAAYNYACFGNALDSGYSHDYCWSAAQGAGISGFTYPHVGPLIDLTFGSYRGLFYASPFLLLGIVGAIFMFRRRLRPEATVCLVSALGFIVAISAYWGWNGGRVDGPRYLVPAIPFLAFPVIFYLQTSARRVWAWGLFVIASVWSVFATWTMFLGGALFPPSATRDPIFAYSLPQLSSNQVAPNLGSFVGLSGWASLVPLVVALLLIGFIGGPGLSLPVRSKRLHGESARA